MPRIPFTSSPMRPRCADIGNICRRRDIVRPPADLWPRRQDLGLSTPSGSFLFGVPLMNIFNFVHNPQNCGFHTYASNSGLVLLTWFFVYLDGGERPFCEIVSDWLAASLQTIRRLVRIWQSYDREIGQWRSCLMTPIPGQQNQRHKLHLCKWWEHPYPMKDTWT